MIIPILSLFMWLGLLYGLLTKNHMSDGNIWGIWMEGNHLMIGDFWHALMVLWTIWIIRDEINALLGASDKKKGDKKDG